MSETLTQAGLQGVVGRVGDAGDFTDRRVSAGSGAGDGATGIEAALIGIVLGRRAGDIDCGFASMKRGNLVPLVPI